jgi:replicative DNA helicase
MASTPDDFMLPDDYEPDFTATHELAAQLGNVRIPPHSVEAEQAVLGGLMLSGDSAEAFDKISDLVVEKDFYEKNHRLIFRAISQLVGESQPADVVTIASYLDQHTLLDEAGTINYIGALAQETPSAANVKYYAGIVRERSVLRQLIAVGNDIAESAFDSKGHSSKALLDKAEERVLSIADQMARTGGGFHDIKSVLAGAVERINYLFESGSSITGMATGFDELDEMTGGFQDSDLIIVAGRPSMGKTTFAMNIAEHAGLTSDAPVAVFSMEMPAEQLGMRMISSLGRVELSKLRSGRLAEQDWPRITSAITLLNQKRNVYIDDTPALTPTDLRARARRLANLHKDKGGLSLIVIDYLQLMQVADSRENRATEISEISRSLKALAKELKVPIVALSQLNRSLEQRPDKRPVMSDLRESGAIEQDADVIIFIYRDEVYNPDDEDSKGKAEILIRKQRNGPIGSTTLTFLGKYTRFENYSPEVYSGEFS